jgi:hypothetical protein
MKIYSISVLRNDGSSANTLAAEYNLAEFGYFQRSRYISETDGTSGQRVIQLTVLIRSH